jgi:hypothetical protein
MGWAHGINDICKVLIVKAKDRIPGLGKIKNKL